MSLDVGVSYTTFVLDLEYYGTLLSNIALVLLLPLRKSFPSQ